MSFHIKIRYIFQIECIKESLRSCKHFFHLEKFNQSECDLMELAQVALLRSVTESITVWVVTERNS